MRTFNMGIGLIAAIPAAKFTKAKLCWTAPKKNSMSSGESPKAIESSLPLVFRGAKAPEVFLVGFCGMTQVVPFHKALERRVFCEAS